jgi:hypothetical protein
MMCRLTLLAFLSCVLLAGTLVAQDVTVKTPPLSNRDVAEMLKAGLAPEIVVAKIESSECDFDTSPATLKELKIANVPDAVILAMVQAPTGERGQKKLDVEPPAFAWIDCKGDPVSVYGAPQTQRDSPDIFRVRCGDRITLLNPGDKQSWLKISTASGQVGYISSALVSRESSQETQPISGPKKPDDTQRATDDLEDCKIRSQNEYEAKMNAIGTMALAPMTRVVASNKLKQNLDAELRQCRSQYESRLKVINGK